MGGGGLNLILKELKLVIFLYRIIHHNIQGHWIIRISFYYLYLYKDRPRVSGSIIISDRGWSELQKRTVKQLVTVESHAGEYQNQLVVRMVMSTPMLAE